MDVAETHGIFVTPSEIIEYLYCPRFIYFMNCLNIPQHEEMRYKVLKGRELHEKKAKLSRDYLRRRLGCIDKEVDVYMVSDEDKIRGKVDEVLFLSDGSLAPLDYKYTEYKEYLYRTHKYQSVLYAVLIKHTYSRAVKKGYICYVRSRNKIAEITYGEEDFIYASRLVDEILRIMEKGFFPKRTRHRIRCIDCCYRNICVE